MAELVVGTKYDEGKLRWDLVPPEFEEVVRVLTYGATKYADRNWERGISYGRLIAATLRHLFAWIRGEREDPETGLHHLAHAGCDILFLLTYELRGMKDFDDRPNTGRSTASEISPGQLGLQSNVPTTSDTAARPQLDRGYGVLIGDSGASPRPAPKRLVDPLELSVHSAS
jgi:hypothetical protein